MGRLEWCLRGRSAPRSSPRVHFAEILLKAPQLNLCAPGSEQLRRHPLTTREIRDFCSDLKVLRNRDLAKLLKWRRDLLREQEKDREAKKKANENPSTLAPRPQALVFGPSQLELRRQDAESQTDNALYVDGVWATPLC